MNKNNSASDAHAVTMEMDLKKEQKATTSRPVRRYSGLAKMFFRGMDLFYGKELTPGKIRLLEILARIPYQAWEIRQYHRLNRRFSEHATVAEAEELIKWSREAQDNEFWHLQAIDEKIREDGIKLNWFKDRLAPPVAVFTYNVFCRILAVFSIKEAFHLNADFEDHAEHEYMSYVDAHPEFDTEKVDSPIITDYGDFETWGDVFRKIALDERGHMNTSLIRCGRERETVTPVSEGIE